MFPPPDGVWGVIIWWRSHARHFKFCHAPVNIADLTFICLQNLFYFCYYGIVWFLFVYFNLYFEISCLYSEILLIYLFILLYISLWSLDLCSPVLRPLECSSLHRRIRSVHGRKWPDYVNTAAIGGSVGSSTKACCYYC